MKYKKITFLMGLLWGLISFGFFEIAIRRGQFFMGNYLMESKHFIAVVDIARADNLMWLFKLLLFPYAAGLDLSIWTIGLIGCIFGCGSSPFQALGKVFVNHPIIEWFVLIIYTIVGGLILIMLPYYFISVVKKLLKV